MKSISSDTVDLILKTARVLRKRKLAENYEKFKEHYRVENSKPFKLPKAYDRFIKGEQVTIEGVECYTFGKSAKAILYLHGGAYVEQPLPFHWRFVSRIAQEGNIRVVLPIYTKAPISRAKETLDSMLGIYLNMVEQHGADNITIMGDSAGGGMSLALCEYLLQQGIDQPRQMILLSPWVDVSMTNPEIPYYQNDYMLIAEELVLCGRMYAEDQQYEYMYNPIKGIAKGLAPITIFVGSAEMFLPDCLRAKQICDQEGVECKLYEFAHMQHVFVVQPITESVEARHMIIDMLK